MANSEIYEPREDSFLLKKHVKEYATGKVLDMCTGSGIQAEEAVKYAKEVTAVDINIQAIRKHPKINFVESNLFEKITDKYDLIICNPPYLPDEPKDPDIALDGGKEGCEFTIKFLEEAKDYLTKNGKVLLLFSSFSKPQKIIKTLNKYYTYKKIDEQQVHFEILYVYLCELKF